jgi:hypothetical protein
VNVPVVDAVWVTLPETASVPLHVDPSAPPPLAVQDDAFDELQVKHRWIAQYRYQRNSERSSMTTSP